jgi:polyferredoxin
VTVCPTGIDIRNGVQMECLACTQCIDACDEIMDRLGRPRGLIRYDSQDGLLGKARRFLRPRVWLYSALMLLGAAVAFGATRKRSDFEVTLLRLPGDPYILDSADVRNSLQVHVVNKRSTPEAFHLEVESAEGMSVVLPMHSVSVEPLSDARVPIFLSVPRDRFRSGFPVRVRIVRAADEQDARVVAGTFLGPSR